MAIKKEKTEKIIRSIYCPECLEKDGLAVALKDCRCPLCNSLFMPTVGEQMGKLIYFGK